MTPPCMVELLCPQCAARHWEIDCDSRGIPGPDVPYSARNYSCPRCGHHAAGFKVEKKSPPEFFLQPHGMYPMSERDFLQWLGILKEHFPDHEMLEVLGTSWYPGNRRSDHVERLSFTMALDSSLHISFSVHAVATGRLYVVVQGTGKSDGEATFWVEPRIELREKCYGFNPTQLKEIASLIGKREVEIRQEWQRYSEDVRAF